MPLPLLLIDGHALHIAWPLCITAGGSSALAGRRPKLGEPTGGIYGFARELMRIIEQEKLEYIAVALMWEKNLRDKIFPGIQRHARKKCLTIFSPRRIREMVDAF